MKNHLKQQPGRNSDIRNQPPPFCRLKRGEIWEDPVHGHRVGCLDIASQPDIDLLMAGEKAPLAILDPPYNLTVFEKRSVEEFIDWCRQWVGITERALCEHSALYVWLMVDHENGFQPLPEFMIMMRDFKSLDSRSFITVRKQSGYRTPHNWMSVRQECLYYIKGSPEFNVQYTDIPETPRGYRKETNGEKTENLEPGKPGNNRPGNVWIDIQEVFDQMKENVIGLYAQKSLKCIERLVLASSRQGELVTDFFGHSGSTLVAAARHGRKCFTCDIDPICAEIMIRRIERYYETGETGWGNRSAFEKELRERG